MNILTALVAPFVALGAMLGGLFVDEPSLGATETIPVTIAFFETTLQDAISSSATSFTLTSATDKDGTTLASSTYAFVIDEGSSNEEIVIADCTGTACTNALRGVSARTGNTEVAALKKAHRRGASIKITDAPILMLVSRILRGEQGVDFTPDANSDLVTKTYVDSLALGTTTIPASYTDDGLVELATGVQAASSTATDGSGSPLALHSRISTSTAPTTGSYVVVTGADGNIASGFIATTTVTQYAISNASTTIFDTGTTTYSKRSDIKYIVVEVVGGGGGGGGCTTNTKGAGGGGAGGYSRETLTATTLSGTTTIQVVVGAGGSGGAGSSEANGSTGATSAFGTYLTATGGAGGTGCNTDPAGGLGGLGASGDINIYGGGGGAGGGNDDVRGSGGSSFYGGGAPGGTGEGTVLNGYPYGGGAQGGARSDGGDSSGGTGASGVVIITEYF